MNKESLKVITLDGETCRFYKYITFSHLHVRNITMNLAMKYMQTLCFILHCICMSVQHRETH